MIETLQFIIDSMNQVESHTSKGTWKLEETTFQGDYTLSITYTSFQGVVDLSLVKASSDIMKQGVIKEMVYEVGSAGLVRIMEAQKSAKGSNK